MIFSPQKVGPDRSKYGNTLLVEACRLVVTSLVLALTASAVCAISIPLGSLSIRSQSGVEVTWDTLLLGTTNEQGTLEIGRIPPGSYFLRLSKEGYEDRSMPVQVDAGNQMLNLPLSLLLEVTPGPSAELLAPESKAADEAVTPSRPETVADPPTSSAWSTVLAAMVIVIAGITIFRLARRRPEADRATAQLARPKVVLGRPEPRSNRSSMLLRELKRREDSLENFVEAGSGGLKRKVIDIEVVDRWPVDDAGGEDR